MNSTPSNALAVVTAADSAYYSLVRGLIRSIREVAPPRSHRLCVIDLGLAPDERAWVEGHADVVAEGRWDLDFPGRHEAARSLQGMTCRPFLPEYFPGSEVYVWLDADTWVQDWTAVSLLRRAAAAGSIGIVPEVDRAYRYHYDTGRAMKWMFGCYQEAFGRETASLLGWNPILGAGVFAMQEGCLGWAAWRERLEVGLQRTSRNIDQTSLNVAVYTGAVDAHFLPSTTNWMCNYACPALDPATGRMVHPMLPHAPLGIVHMAGRGPKAGPVELSTTEGGSHTRWLTFGGEER